MFRHALIVLITVVLLITVVACKTPEPAQIKDKIGVAVTILPQQEFVARVGGDKVDITVMVPPGASPHTYEVVPAQMVKLSKAKAYFKVGSPVEFELAWLDKLTASNKNMAVIDCSRGIELIQSDDPDEPGIDAHIWTSPVNVKVMVNNICEGLMQVDSTNKAYYEENRDTYLAALDKLDSDIRESLQSVSHRTLIVYHPAWGYFVHEYGLKQVGIEQEGKEPKAAYLARLISEAKAQNIKVVFISPEYDTKNAETVAREIGGRVVIISPLARDYLDNMRQVAAAFKEAMKQ